MNENDFFKRKEILNKQIKVILSKDSISKQDKASLNKILEILNQYTFENRLNIKGLLSHTIIDSLSIENFTGEKIIKFDTDIK